MHSVDTKALGMGSNRLKIESPSFVKFISLIKTMLIVTSVYIGFGILIPKNNFSSCFLPLYFYSIILKQILVLISMVRFHNDMNDNKFVRLMILSFIPFNCLVNFYYIGSNISLEDIKNIPENIKSIPENIKNIPEYIKSIPTNILLNSMICRLEPEECLDRTLGDVYRPYGPRGVYDILNPIFEGYKTSLESQDLTPRFNELINKLGQPNFQNTLTFSNLAFLKYVSTQYEFSLEAKTLLKGFGNGEECCTANRTSLNGSFKKVADRNLIIEELIRIRGLHFQDLRAAEANTNTNTNTN